MNRIPMQASRWQKQVQRPVSVDELARPPEAVSLDQVRALPRRPGLFIDEPGWAALRSRVHDAGPFGQLFGRVRAMADACVDGPATDFTPADAHANIAPQVRVAERRIRGLAMTYRLTGEARYFDAALREMRALAAFEWPRGHFMDVTLACFGLAVGYDWLFDRLAAADRDHFAWRMASSGLDSSLRDEGPGWIDADHNWNQVLHGGLVAGAIVTAQRNPALSQRVINRAIAMLPRVGVCYAPDGVFPEGPGYWGYGTLFHVIQVDLYRRAFGQDFGLSAFPGFAESAAVLDRITGPSGQFFNYFDNKAEREHLPAVVWFARERGDAGMLRRELARALRGPDAAAGAKDLPVDLQLSLLWLDPTLLTGVAAHDDPPPRTTPRTPPPHASVWQGDGFNPVAVLQAGDGRAGWLAVKGGGCDHSHGHMDAGSFVFEADGVRWAIDPDMEEYQAVKHRTGMTHGQLFSYAQDSRRWDVLRLGPDGHNILRFDGGRQRVGGRVEAGRVATSDGGAAVEFDLSPLYVDDMAAVHRRLELTVDGTLMLEDRWAGGPSPRRVSWQWLTVADATMNTAMAVRLHQAGRCLELRLHDTPGATVRIEDVSAGLRDGFDAPYPGLTRVVIELDAAARSAGRLRVSAALRESGR